MTAAGLYVHVPFCSSRCSYCDFATGLFQRELAEAISSDPNTIASLLERMEANGLIERAKDRTDRRARRIQPLQQGRKAYKTARAIALELQTDILASLPETDREAFLKNLNSIAEACNYAAEKSATDRHAAE